MVSNRNEKLHGRELLFSPKAESADPVEDDKLHRKLFKGKWIIYICRGYYISYINYIWKSYNSAWELYDEEILPIQVTKTLYNSTA